MSLNITERERQIVSGLAAGMTGKRIALAMCIDPKTVEWHLRACRKRNNAKTSAQLVYMATLAGLVDIHSVHAKKPRNAHRPKPGTACRRAAA